MRPPQQYPRSAVLATAAAVLVGTVGVALPFARVQVDTDAYAAGGVDTSSQQAYIRSVAPMAQAAHTKYGVPASVSIAQSILESGWGKSTLTTRHHAYFGIKCSKSGTYATGCVSMRTMEYDGRGMITDGFRTYAKPLDSFLDHGQFLRINSRYAAAFNHPNDANQFLREVHKAGYATDPTYSSMVIGIMRDYKLYAYDKAATAAPTTARTTTPAAAPSTPGTSVPASRTATPSATATPSRTVTPSATATPSRTVTPSATATSSRTATPSRTAMPSATATPSRTVTPSATASPRGGAVTPAQPKDPNVLEIPKAKDAVPVPVAAPAADTVAKDGAGGLAKTGD